MTDQELAGDLNYPYEHAAGGETSLLMAIRPELVDLSKTLETEGSLKSYYAQQAEHLRRRRETPHKYIGVDTGVTDASNDPESTASSERGRRLLAILSARIAEHARSLLDRAR